MGKKGLQVLGKDEQHWKEAAMSLTVTGVYKDADAARNAADDLVYSGFDREKVFLDRDAAQVKVMIPDSVEREVKEILDRHSPTEVTSH